MNDDTVQKEVDWQGAIDAYYLEDKTVASIVEAFELPVEKTIYKAFPAYVHDSLLCEHCDIPMESSYLNRTASKTSLNFIEKMADEPITEEPYHDSYSYRSPRRIGSDVKAIETEEGYCVSLPVCPKCHHSPHHYCECDHCVDLKTENKKRVVEHIREELKKEENPIPDFHSLECEVIFLALYGLTYGVSDHDQTISLSHLPHEERDMLIEKGLFCLDDEALDQAVEMTSVCAFNYAEKRIPYKLNHDDLTPTQALSQLTKAARIFALKRESFADLLDLWSKIARKEAMDVMQHYCDVYGLPFRPGEKTVSAVQKSLNRFGLAQTARYIYNAVRRAQNKGREEGKSGRESFNKIYGFLSFWLEDERAKDYNAAPFNRGNQVLSEPRSAIVFSHAFLEFYDINYFSQAINMNAYPS